MTVAFRKRFDYPKRYLLAIPAWLESYREDFRDDIEAEYLIDQRQAQRAREES